MDDVASLLTGAGFTRNGETAKRTVREVTKKSPVFGHGKSGGKAREYGGRQRWVKGDVHVTVGPRTVFVFRVMPDGIKRALGHLDTKDLDGLRIVISTSEAVQL